MHAQPSAVNVRPGSIELGAAQLSGDMMRVKVLSFCGATLALFAAWPAFSLEMRVSGREIVLSGGIINGDEHRFRDLIENPAHAGVRVVRLNSGGGKIAPAGEIGRMIRKRGMATLLDAASGRCGSACTVIFSSGSTRHYVNGERVTDQPVPKANYRGLAFHEGSSPLSTARNRYSGQATAELIGWYYEFGTSAAKDLATKAPPEGFYQISGPTALSLGIATSLSRP